MGLLLEMEGMAFKPRTYEKAAQAVAGTARPLAELAREGGVAGLSEIPGVGRGIAERIVEFLASGRMHDLEDLRKRRPVDVLGLTAVEGLGPRKVRALYEALGVRDRHELEQACRAGKVREVPGFGVRSEERIAAGLAFLAKAGGRRPLGQVLPLARTIEERLRAVPGVVQAAVAGSVRRGRETIGDVDLVVSARDPARVMRAFTTLSETSHVHQQGSTRARVRLVNGMDADLRVVADASFGAALLYLTGSRDHDVALRRMAQGQGLKLSEYGLFRGTRKLAGRTEEEVYRALGLPWIPPELREDRGELDAARQGRLPRLIERGDLKGDLQVQTEWTDGEASIEEMAEAARARGLEYVAITDHTRDLGMAGGSDEAKLRRQIRAIGTLNRHLKGFRVLTGAEVNIREGGTLDVDDAVLARLDVVGAAVHSHFRQSRERMTARLVRAMENPHVDILFHPTGRLLGHREAVALDVDELVRAARRTHTVLEIDAMPERLDLGDEIARKAVEAGVLLCIDSDAHHPDHLAYADEYGITVARRAWARKQDVLNTLSAEACLARLGTGRR
jgi:DNA polymerase (family 10)